VLRNLERASRAEMVAVKANYACFFLYLLQTLVTGFILAIPSPVFDPVGRCEESEMLVIPVDEGVCMRFGPSVMTSPIECHYASAVMTTCLTSLDWHLRAST
jgi:hypothetical protein